MELRQLEYFVAVADEASFTRAAQRVHISQSGVSAQVRQLERELGADLLDRSGRVVTTTAAGAAALGPARAALAAAAALRQAVDDVTGLLRGRLSVGMVSGCTITELFDALAVFYAAHPGVEIALYEESSDRLIEAIRDGTTDLALVGTAGGLPEGVAGLPIVTEPVVAAVPPDHPLAPAESVPLAKLCGYPLVCMPRGTGVRAVLDGACAAAGLRPEIALEASAPAAVADLAARGLGAAVLSRSMTTPHASRLRVLTIEDVATPGVLALIWPRRPSAALRELVGQCRRAFRAA